MATEAKDNPLAALAAAIGAVKKEVEEKKKREALEGAIAVGVVLFLLDD